MKKEEILIVGRQDLTIESRNKNIVDIDGYDLKGSEKSYTTNGIVMFVDDNGATKIMKNRYGDRCEELFEELYKQKAIKSEPVPVKKRNVKVLITGSIGSGKSRILYLIKKTLKQNGIETAFMGTPDFNTAYDFDRKMDKNFDDAISAISERTVVELEEIQLPRE